MDITQFRSRVRAVLMDTSALLWSDPLLDEAARQALDDYSLAAPVTRSGSLLLEEDGIDLDLSSLTGLVDLLSVDDAEDEARGFEGWNLYWDGATPRVLLGGGETVQPGDLLRVRYCTRQTMEGLDDASATTIDPRCESLLVRGAAGYAAKARALERSAGYQPDLNVSVALENWGRAELRAFALDLERVTRWNRSGLLDAVRWGLLA